MSQTEQTIKPAIYYEFDNRMDATSSVYFNTGEMKAQGAAVPTKKERRADLTSTAPPYDRTQEANS